MRIVRVTYVGKNDNKEHTGTFIKVGKEHYVPIAINPAMFELPFIKSETDLSEGELLR